MRNKVYVQYGCGMSAPIGWENFDASPTLRFEQVTFLGKLYTKNSKRFPENIRYGDIVKGLPVGDESCSVVYCSHVLEHLSLGDFRIALINTYRLLQTGGLFRFVIPDLEYLIKEYDKNISPDAAINFMKNTGLGKINRKRSLRNFMVEWLGNSNHLWMWDYKSIERELLRAGFKKIRRALYGDSVETKYREVEDVAAWNDSLGVECIK